MVSMKKERWPKNEMLRTASAVAMLICALASSHSASAQTAAPDPEREDAGPVEIDDVVVTATRVVRDGYNAPTPTAVLGAEDIAARAPANIADLVNVMPALASSATPRTTVSQLSSGNYGINALNLRNLGQNRTLVLLDGQRVGSSTLAGWVDINNFPQALISRVDVVTGGASASWGSDAVAGVVNFVLDRNFTGAKGLAQAGQTTHGDGATYNLALTVGTGFANDHGHFVISVEDNYNDGIRGVPRDWFDGTGVMLNPAWTATNGQPRLLVGNHIGLSGATPGGIITTGPLRGTYFGEGGTPTVFNYGSMLAGSALMQGGDWEISNHTRGGDLDGQSSRQNVFLRASYDVTDHVRVFAQASYSAATAKEAFSYFYRLGNAAPLIQTDNAFIPSSLSPTAAFRVGTFNQDMGPIPLENERVAWRGVVGANGDFDALGSNWDWDVYAQRSENRIRNSGVLAVTANYLRAVDAVFDSSGRIVCRSTLTDPTNGCIPYNIFGTGVNSQAAIDYINEESWSVNTLTQDVYAANIRGEPFSNWAGPVSVAAGLEHRREEVSGTNDPLSTTRAFWAGNYRGTNGQYDVAEGYVETVVPLLRDQALAESLDLNAAVRLTDYSTSGEVTTWKVGATYMPVEDIIFRATRSHDIRAPNLGEIFQNGSFAASSGPNPWNGNATDAFSVITQGSAAVAPEEADAYGVGVVLRPRFFPGFQASMDYYEIEIQGAIQTLTGQQLISQCFTGNTALCSQITGFGTSDITQVIVEPVNVASQMSRGLDIEASYRVNLEGIAPWLGGELALRAMATHYLENRIDDRISPPTDNVGTNSSNGGAFLTLPDWRYLASIDWENGPTRLSFVARGVSDGVYNTSFISCASGCPTSTSANLTINDNHIPGQFYYDVSISYDVREDSQVFMAVDNIFDTDPVPVGYHTTSGESVGGANLGVNPALTDTLGRVIRVGVRFRM